MQMYPIEKNLKNDEEEHHQVSTENIDQVADVAAHVDDDNNTQVIKDKDGSSWQTLTLSPRSCWTNTIAKCRQISCRAYIPCHIW